MFQIPESVSLRKELHANNALDELLESLVDDVVEVLLSLAHVNKRGVQSETSHALAIWVDASHLALASSHFQNQGTSESELQ